jgi:hypothetical protein
VWSSYGGCAMKAEGRFEGVGGEDGTMVLRVALNRN